MCLAIPGQIVSVGASELCTGVVDVGGVRHEVNLTCILPEDEPIESLVGRWVIVHVGFALGIMDEAEAQAMLATLREVAEQIEDGVQVESPPPLEGG